MDVGEGLRPRPLVSIFLGLQRPPVKATVYQNVSGAPRIRDWGRESRCCPFSLICYFGGWALARRVGGAHRHVVHHCVHHVVSDTLQGVRQGHGPALG